MKKLLTLMLCVFLLMVSSTACTTKAERDPSFGLETQEMKLQIPESFTSTAQTIICQST